MKNVFTALLSSNSEYLSVEVQSALGEHDWQVSFASSITKQTYKNK